MINYNDVETDMSDDFSCKDFTRHEYVEIPNGVNVYMSCFSCEQPTAMFPADMTGVTFYNCNLTNCTIPDGNTVVGGTWL